MESSTRFLVAALSLSLTIIPVGTLAAQGDRPAEGHWACFSGNENNPIYVTPVWDGTATMDGVQSRFAQMLATRFGYKGRVSCSRANMGGSTLADIQAGLKDQYARWEKNGKKVVQTGWIYGSPDTGPAAPAAVPASPSPGAASSEGSKWAVCRMVGVLATGPRKSYVSGVMQLPASIGKDSLERAFAGFLGMKYKVTRRTAECTTSAARPDAAAGLETWVDQAAKLPATYGTTIKTGWVYSQ